jgi:hypothetical protein
MLHVGETVPFPSAEQVTGPQALPGAAGEQVPVGFAQVWQLEHDTDPQQVRSTQLFDRQSPPARQLAPLGFFVGALQTPPLQVLPVTQSPLPAQVVGHAPVLQR